MRPIFNTIVSHIKGAKVWRKRNRVKLESAVTPNRKLEDITKAVLFSVGNLKKTSKSLNSSFVIDNLIKIENLQGKPYHVHFIVLPTGRIYQCCRLDVYIENPHFDKDSIGVALLTPENFVIPRMCKRSLTNIYKFWEKDLRWIIAAPKWKHSAFVYEEDSTTEYFERIWESCVDETKTYITMEELKKLLKTILFRKTIKVKHGKD